MSHKSVAVSLASHQHLSFMCDIYAHHVLEGTGSFEEQPPSLNDIEARWQVRESRHQPTLVATCDGQLAGFAYAASHKERSAYRFTVEDSIYIAPGFIGQGVGRALLNELINECTERQFRQMIAAIGDSNNQASIALHEQCGFRNVGVATNVGFKFNSWLDIVYMQRALI